MSIILPNNNISQPAVSNINLNLINDGVINYWFFHKPTFPNLHPNLYKELVSNAQYNVDIWDPYFHISNTRPDYIVFDSIKNNITIRILGCIGLEGARANYLTDTHTAIKTYIPNSKNTSFCIGVINSRFKPNWKFHDRFLIIDNTEVYLIGASVEYNHFAKESCGIYKIPNLLTSQFIINQFNTHWNETEKHPSTGVEFLHP